ncbi:NUDIX hydrolase [Nonomuraea sp. NPDC050663]|uniref:NUDIX hydrolase n=1 Tax=Nonomuraea sp. NPDC050663 TaxID=3364370 RepID=UPI0037A10595
MTPSRVTEFRRAARERLAGYKHTTLESAPGMRAAAVVLCVVPGDDGAPCVVVIKRAYRGRNAGQWGLPGGRTEPGESPEQAALRELEEELGLVVGPADVVGRLDDFPAASGFAITPIVAVPAAVQPLRPDPREVHSAHRVPLERLAADDVPKWVDLPDGPPLLQMWLAPDMRIHAPTGAILWQFREVVLLGREAAESRVAHFRQPVWTRR